MDTPRGADLARGSRWSRWANVALCVLLFFLIGAAFGRIAAAPSFGQLFLPLTVAGDRGDQPVVIEEAAFEHYRSGNRVGAAFSLLNKGDRPVRDIEISCQLKDRQDRSWGSARWVIYETLAPRSERRFDIVDHRYIAPQVTSDAMRCRIAGAQVLD